MGENFLHNYLGNIGIPINLHPEFPTNAESRSINAGNSNWIAKLAQKRVRLFQYVTSTPTLIGSESVGALVAQAATNIFCR
jgi:hypothetical protein